LSRSCTVCRHPARTDIEVALVSGRAVRDIAGQHAGLSKSSLARHKDEHLSESILSMRDERASIRVRSLLQEAEALLMKVAGLLQSAEDSGDLRTAIMGVREARGCVELLSRLRPQTERVLVDEEWDAIRDVLREELEPYPDLTLRIAARLRAL
jgi:hypothetical protein